MQLLSTYHFGFKEKKYSTLSWDMFETLSQLIAKDILNQKLNQEKVCLLGTARGALPLLTYISHKTELRDISIMQLQMTNSNKPFDYGDVSILLKAIRSDYDKFIILEDIIYKGTTVQCIQNELEKDNNKILGIYSLLVDEEYNNTNIHIEIKSSALLKKDTWIRFPWEKETCIG